MVLSCCEALPGLVSKLPPRRSPQESREQELRQRLLDEQFAVLQRTAAEAERILQDAVGKLDDPLHLRCTSSPGRAAGQASATFSLTGWQGRCSPTPRGSAPHPFPSPLACRLLGEQGPGSPGRCGRPGDRPCPVPDLQVR